MKAQFLKLAGAKNEADFYRMYPTEESFMAKFGAKLKAQYGNQIPDYVDTSIGTTAGGANRFNLNKFGMPYTNIPQGIEFQQGNPFAKSNPFATDTTSQAWAKAHPAVGNQLPKDIGYKPTTGASSSGDPSKAIQTGIGMVDSVVSGIKNLKAEKKALKSARIWKDVSDLSRRAAGTTDVNKNAVITDNQRRLRKAMMPTVTGEELFPVTGVGTNVLAKEGAYVSRKEDYGSEEHPYPTVKSSDFAGGGRSYPIPSEKNAKSALFLAKIHHRPDVIAKVHERYPNLKKKGGGEIQNTYAPNFLYDDLGYEPGGESDPGFRPLPDSEIIKAFRSGGLIPIAQSGFSGPSFSNMMSYMGGGTSSAGGTPWGLIGNMGGSIAGSAFGNNAGTQIGGGIGEAAGSIFGPIGGAVGKIAGTALGGLFDRNPQKTKKAQEAMMRNVNAMSGKNAIHDMQSGYSGVFEEGGNLSRDWQPQVLTYFGEHSMAKLLAPDKTMDTLRTGGNLRKNSIGDIRIDASRGELEPISYNPNTPGTGITSMIKGPSHDDGGINVSYNGNMVEAEGGEPITERQEGGSVGDTAAVITGDQTFNKMGANEIPELSEYVGKKVKNIHKELAERDAKLNKLQTKNSAALAEFNPRTPIDKLTFNSLTMNEKGVQQQYKRNALKTQSLIAYQDAINQEAESRGLDAGELSRGKIKPLPPEEMMGAKYGVSLFTQAQGGRNIYKEMEESFGEGGSPLTGSAARAFQRAADAKRAEQAKLVEEVRKMNAGRMKGSYVNPQDSPEHTAKRQAATDLMMKQLTNPNQGLFNTGFNINDPSTYPKPKAKVTVTKPAVNTPAPTSASNVVAKSQASTAASPSGARQVTAKSVTTPKQSVKQIEATVPNTQDLPPISKENFDKLQALYKEAEKFPDKKSPQTLAFQKFYHQVAPDYAKAVLASEPTTAHGRAQGLAQTNLASNEDSIFGKRTKQYMAALKDPGAAKPAETPAGTPAGTTAPADKDTEGVFETSPYHKYGWENLATQILPWLRRTPGEPLLGDQLAGEMYAMSHNQEEPVQARYYHPQLDVPYDISFQDRLNENNATFRALTRAAGAGNPEALSMLAGQKYGQDSNVLAEQFRANQAKKDQVYSQNRATLNDAMLKNLSIADQQYVRQAQAKSNTKAAMQEALNSIASKIGQNRLENRTLQTYANMFPDFSFGKDYTIRKTGAPTNFNMPVVYNAAGDITHVALYDSDGKIYDYRELTPAESKAMGKKAGTSAPAGATPGIVKEGSHTTGAADAKKERNGGLVRAFKNL